MSNTTRFDQLGLAAPIMQALQEIGYETPSPIQAAGIPHLMEGRDLIGQAQTGTGKTAAFALPLLSRLDQSLAAPQVLVLTPTRELAIQVAEAFQAYARNLKNFHVLPIYGGQGMQNQLRMLKRGVQVIIGTPGRVMDHLRRKSLSLTTLRALVLDEADEMLKMGFIEDVEWILEQTPSTRQVALFSATMPDVIRKVAQKHLREPVHVKIESKTTTVETINQRYWQVSGVHKLDALTRILEVEDFDAVLIFVRTKSETVSLAEKLEARGFATSALNGDMNQAHRERTIEQLKSKKLDIVVATDVAARGLDVQRITHVVNYDIPYDTESYVHRIGRTGRAGRKGSAILFVAPREMRMLRAIEKATRQTIERMQLPTSESIADKRLAQFKQQILDTVEAEDLEVYYDIVRQCKEEQNLSTSDVAAALTFLLQQQRPIKRREPATPAEIPQASTHKKAKSAEFPRTEQAVERKPRDTKTSEKRSQGKPPRLKKHPDVELVRYRIEVGHNQGAMPKDIVGAIANEAGIDSEFIGHIKLYDDYSTVDLPEGMPKSTFQHLKRVRVREYPLQISIEGETASEPRSDAQAIRPGKAAASGKRKGFEASDKSAHKQANKTPRKAIHKEKEKFSGKQKPRKKFAKS